MDADFMWGGLYQAIARANGAIAAINTVSSPTNTDELAFNDVAGHAYFVRAWAYFKLATHWGDIPLWLELPSEGNTNKAKSCLLYTSPSPRDTLLSRMPSSA